MVTTFYPPHVGGVEYHVENLSKELVLRGHNVTVLTSEIGSEKNYALSNGIELFRFRTLFFSGKFYPSLSSQGILLNIDNIIKGLVKKKNIDIIHVHGHHYYLTWQGIRAAEKLGVPCVLTLHGLYALNPSDPIAQIWEEIFNLTIFRRCLTKVDKVIGLTPAITNFAQKYDPSTGKYFTVPNGVRLNSFQDNLENQSHYRKKYSIPQNKLVVLFVGRFASIKGVIELAKAAKLLLEKSDSFFFVFVGGGPLTVKLAQTLRPIKNASLMIDWVAADKIHELYIASDIFVLSSKSEALPLTILEAMAAQRYIVATSVGGVPEVLTSYSRKTLIDRCSPVKIYRAILQVSELPNFSQNLLNNEDCMRCFDWAKIACQVEKVYFSSINRERIA